VHPYVEAIAGIREQFAAGIAMLEPVLAAFHVFSSRKAVAAKDEAS